MRRIIIAYLWILAITNVYGMEKDFSQKNNPMDVEVTSSRGGCKHLREEKKEEKRDVHNEITLFYIQDLFYMISVHLNFEDRVTRLGATCPTFRHWMIREIVDFSDQFEYDLVNISLEEYLHHISLSLVKVSPQELLQRPQPISSLYPGSRPTNYILEPNFFSREYQVFQLLRGIEEDREHKVPANFILELANGDTRNHEARYCIKRNINKGKYNFINNSIECLKYIPIEYLNLFIGYTEYQLNMYLKPGFPNLEEKHLNTNQYLKAFSNLQVLDLCENKVVTDDTLSCLTNLRKLSLEKNPMITSDSLKYLTNLLELNLESNEVIDDNVLMHLTRLQELNLSENGVITSRSVRYLTNLASIKISMDTQMDKQLDDEPCIVQVFGPILETLPKLKYLNLDTFLPFSYENLFGLTNLTCLEINERLYDNHQTPNNGKFEYNVNLINSMVWERLPNLDRYSHTSLRFNFSETRQEFTKREEFRINLVDNISQKQPNNLLKSLSDIRELDLSDNEVIVDNTMNFTNLQNMTENGIITATSISYLRSLKEIKISIIDPLQDEPTDAEHFCFPLLAPIMETFSNLEYLKLDTSLPVNYKNLFGLINLTRLEINENLGCKYSATWEGIFEYNLNLINSMLWERLPKLDWYSYASDHCKFSENRQQFTEKKELRKNVIEKIKQGNPYSPWKEINEKVKDLLQEQIENNK